MNNVRMPLHTLVRWSPDGQAVPLRCLDCNQSFLSEHKGIRLCPPCRAEAANQEVVHAVRSRRYGSPATFSSGAGPTTLQRDGMAFSGTILGAARTEATGRKAQTLRAQSPREMTLQEGAPVTPEEKARRKVLEDAIAAGDAMAARVYWQRYAARLVVHRGQPVQA